MILQSEFKIKINSKNYKYYKHLNNIKKGGEYIIDINQLHKGSHIKIKVECDVCHKQSSKPYRQYLESFNKREIYCCSPKCAQIKNKETNIGKYGCENVFQNKEIKEKIVKTNNVKYRVNYHTQSDNFKEKSKMTNIDRYGYENAAKSIIIQNKMKKTCLERYGVENYMKSEQMKKHRIKNGTKIPDELKKDYEKYLFEVRYLTYLQRKKLFKEWNGLDYYDDEPIKENFNLEITDKLYPTIDHKISIYHGYFNNISPEEISNIGNLCITKRGINSSKNTKCFFEKVV